MTQISALTIVQTRKGGKVVNGTVTTFGTTAVTVFTATQQLTLSKINSQMVSFGTGTSATLSIIIAGVTINIRAGITVADATYVESTIFEGIVMNVGDSIQFSGNAAGNNETANYIFVLN